MPLLDARIAALSAKSETALIQIVHTAALELHFVGLREGSLLDAFRTRYDGGGTALELVKMIIETFPPFRLPSRGRMRQAKPFLEPRADSPRRVAHGFPSRNCTLPSRRRTWPHSLLLGGVDVLTMLMDYRVRQVLHRSSAAPPTATLGPAVRTHRDPA
jgi:hypothetical protein